MLRFIEKFTYPLALLTAVLGVVYWYWTTTPSYALTAVVTSIKNRDTKMFEKYVDIDSVASHAFDDLTEGPARSVLLGRMDNFIGVGFIKFFKREVVGMAHEKVLDFVNGGSLKVDSNEALLLPGSGFISIPQQGISTEPPNIALAANANGTVAAVQHPDNEHELLDDPKMSSKTKYQLRQYGLTREGFKGIKYLKTNGSTALLGLEFFSPKLNNSWVVEFKMEDAGGYWHITELSNLNELVGTYLRSRSS